MELTLISHLDFPHPLPCLSHTDCKLFCSFVLSFPGASKAKDSDGEEEEEEEKKEGKKEDKKAPKTVEEKGTGMQS